MTIPRRAADRFPGNITKWLPLVIAILAAAGVVYRAEIVSQANRSWLLSQSEQLRDIKEDVDRIKGKLNIP